MYMIKKILSFIKCLLYKCIAVCKWIIDRIIVEIVLWTIINSIFFTLFIIDCIKTISIKIFIYITHSCYGKWRQQTEKLDSDSGKSNT
jgi:hypothetical protein